MEDSFSSVEIVNNVYDYSNVLPTIQPISYLVNFCSQMNEYLTKLTIEDEEKNKPFKSEFKEYMYKSSYGQKFEVSILKENYNYIYCKNYEEFMSAVNNGNLNKVKSLEIELCMDFYRGKGEKPKEHENSFIIRFEPYKITFTRKSNFNDPQMDKVESQINSIMKSFKVGNCIFCNKTDDV